MGECTTYTATCVSGGLLFLSGLITFTCCFILLHLIGVGVQGPIPWLAGAGANLTSALCLWGSSTAGKWATRKMQEAEELPDLKQGDDSFETLRKRQRADAVKKDDHKSHVKKTDDINAAKRQLQKDCITRFATEMKPFRPCFVLCFTAVFYAFAAMCSSMGGMTYASFGIVTGASVVISALLLVFDNYYNILPGCLKSPEPDTLSNQDFLDLEDSSNSPSFADKLASVGSSIKTTAVKFKDKLFPKKRHYRDPDIGVVGIYDRRLLSKDEEQDYDVESEHLAILILVTLLVTGLILVLVCRDRSQPKTGMQIYRQDGITVRI